MKLKGDLDGLSLGALVAPGKQHDQERAVLHELDTVAGAVMNPHFRYALSNGGGVSLISVPSDTVDSRQDGSPGPDILEAVKPA